MFRLRWTILVLFLLSLAGIVGCGKRNAAEKKKELVILCGSSFVKPTEQLCSEFTAETAIKTVITVGGSEDFLPLVKAGRKGDVFKTVVNIIKGGYR